MRVLEKQIDRALKQLDPLLFLDKRYSVFSGLYYCVCTPMEDGSEPWVVLDWRVGIHPRELSMDIVMAVAANEGDMSDAINQATANNAARKELMRQERLSKQDEAISDWQSSKPGKVGVVVPEKKF